jgi:hypothetical protein
MEVMNRIRVVNRDWDEEVRPGAFYQRSHGAGRGNRVRGMGGLFGIRRSDVGPFRLARRLRS